MIILNSVFFLNYFSFVGDERNSHYIQSYATVHELSKHWFQNVGKFSGCWRHYKQRLEIKSKLCFNWNHNTRCDSYWNGNTKVASWKSTLFFAERSWCSFLKTFQGFTALLSKVGLNYPSLYGTKRVLNIYWLKRYLRWVMRPMGFSFNRVCLSERKLKLIILVKLIPLS